jgi:hypothetical protein
MKFRKCFQILVANRNLQKIINDEGISYILKTQLGTKTEEMLPNFG